MHGLVDVIIPATSKPEVERVVWHLGTISDSIHEIIIVDFFMERPSLERYKVDELRRSGIRMKYVYLNNEEYFNKAKALNVGFSYSVAPLIIVCDADVLLDKEFINTAKSLVHEDSGKGIFYTPEYVIESDNGEKRPAPGICLMRRDDFLSVNGYCNEYHGWGMEDMDFLKRLEEASISRLTVSYGVHLSHSDLSRTKNYHSESVPQMRLSNRALYAEKVKQSRLYGTLDLDIMCCNYTE